MKEFLYTEFPWRKTFGAFAYNGHTDWQQVIFSDESRFNLGWWPHPWRDGLGTGLRLRIMDAVSCYATAVGWSPKSFPTFKAFLELYFLGMFKTFQHNRYEYFLGLLFHWICRRLNMSGIPLFGVSLVILVPQLLQMNFGFAYKQSAMLILKQTHSKSVWFHVTSYSSKYWFSICNIFYTLNF